MNTTHKDKLHADLLAFLRARPMPANQHLETLALDRTLLSSERTFSAWIPTGLAGVGGGLAVSRALVFQSPVQQVIATVVAGLLVIWGGSLFVYAMIHYRRNCVRLARARGAEQSTNALMVMTAVLLLVAARVFGLCVSGSGITSGAWSAANSPSAPRIPFSPTTP